MILSATSESGERPAAPDSGGATLDDLFRRTATARPDALALVDPPDRASFTDGAPRSMTWAEADRIVSAIANLLRSLGLSPTLLRFCSSMSRSRHWTLRPEKYCR